MRIPPPAPDGVEISVVIPCLNEADTIADCVRRALDGIESSGAAGEVVVSDNGSTDGSQALAAGAGARVVTAHARGYGNALMTGIDAARGRYVLMGDADMSYDFGELPQFLAKLRQGSELVQGCRLRVGGGRVMAGAMPPLHRWFGNPALSWLARRFFGAPVHDVYCGLRAFTKDLYRQLDQRCTGMEFATEMIIKSSLLGARISEIPVTLHPDRRRAHAPHLRTFRDGWRTLRLYLVYTPRWLFLVPGFALLLLGIGAYAIALPGLGFSGVVFDAHTLLFGSLAVLCGYQAVLFAIFTKTLAVVEGMHPPDEALTRFYAFATLEKGVVLAAIAMAGGLVLLLLAVNTWRLADFGPLEYPVTMRLVIPGATIFALGFQTLLSSFFVSILGMQRR